MIPLILSRAGEVLQACKVTPPVSETFLQACKVTPPSSEKVLQAYKVTPQFFLSGRML